MNKNFMIFCATTLVCAVSVYGQEKEKVQKLEEVVVTDSRFKLKRENSGKTVIRISQEELERNQGRTISEIINTKSGISIAGANGRDGAILGVYARGGRGRQVLIVVDGVRVSDPSSVNQEYDLRLLSTANVKSIEILKGAASTLYGTNAATAVINITTKNASDRKISGNFNTTIGTNNSFNNQNINLNEFTNSTQISGSLSKFSYAVGFSNRYSDGLSAIVTPTDEKDDFSNFNTDVKLGYNFSDNFSLKLYGNHAKTRTQFDESSGMYDAAYEFFSEQKRVGMSANYKYNKGELVLNTAYSDYASESVSAFPSTYAGNNLVVDLYNKYNINDKFYTILGANYIKDETEYAEIQDFTIIDPYANAVFVSDFGLNVNAGARLNNHSEYGSHFVYNVNPSFNFYSNNGYVKLMGSYATSYITPSLNQLFGNFGANPNLEPEENITIEAGLEFANKKGLRINSVYFNRNEENTIIYGTGYENATTDATVHGIEFEAELKKIKDVTISANYTFTELKEGVRLRIPKHKANASLGYNFCKNSFTSINYQFVGSRTDKDLAIFQNVDLDSFSLVGLYFSHRIVKNKVKLFTSVTNLFNEDYSEILGFTTKGRNVSVGLNLSL